MTHRNKSIAETLDGFKMELGYEGMLRKTEWGAWIFWAPNCVQKIQALKANTFAVYE